MNKPRSSSLSPFPYGYPGRVCYIALRDGRLEQVRTREGIRVAVREAQAGECQLFAAWPGEHRTDLFVIDDLDALAKAVAA